MLSFDVCRRHLLSNLYRQKVAKYHSLICDETKGNPCVEQASVVNHYAIEDTCEPTERLMEYNPLEATNAKSIT